MEIKVLAASGVEFPGQNPLSLLPTPTLLCARRIACLPAGRHYAILVVGKEMHHGRINSKQ
jgi:hypothetical protein